MRRQASPRAWLRTVLVVAVAVTALAAPQRAAAQELPLEPTGRAVCNLAFTLAGAISYAGATVPAGAPISPNDVVIAITPLLRACGALFPAAPPRQCFLGDAYPSTGLPLTLPDPVGIATEQAEALAALVDPLGLALSGPLRQLFADALQCREQVGLPDDPPGDVVLDGATEVPAPPSPPTLEAAAPAAPLAPPSDPPVAAAAPAAAPAPHPVQQQVPAAPFAPVLSAVPEELQGAAAAGSAGLVAGLGLLLHRQLSPRRRRSLLDLSSEPRP